MLQEVTGEADNILRGWMASDDLANWEGQDLDESEVPHQWLELLQGGQVIGRIRLAYNHNWTIELDGGDKPFSVRRQPHLAQNLPVE